MLINENVQSQRMLLLKLLQLTKGMHIALDRLEKEMEVHGHGHSDHRASSAGDPVNHPSMVQEPGFGLEPPVGGRTALDTGPGETPEALYGNGCEVPLADLARQHAGVMEELILTGLSETPELLDLALEAQDRVREITDRLEICRDHALELLGSHTRQRHGAAAYASQAMTPGR